MAASDYLLNKCDQIIRHVKKSNNNTSGYLYFPAPGPLLGPSPWPQFVFNGPGPQFVFTDPGPKFVFTGLGQSEAWACIYKPCSPNLYLLSLAYEFYYCALNLHLPSYV